MKYIIGLVFLVSIIIILIPPYKVSYQAPPEPIVVVKTVPHKHLHRKMVYYPIPLKIVERVSKETGVSQDIIARIILAESLNDPNAKNTKNKNKTTDFGLFQINSIHLVEAEKLKIDIFTPEGNADFAILLMKRNGLRDWSASAPRWN